MLVLNFEVLFHFNLKTVHFSTLWNVTDLATLKGKAWRKIVKYIANDWKRALEFKAEPEGFF